MKYRPLNMFTKQTDELKKLIEEHPTYPIIVVCEAEVVADDSGWWYAPDLRFTIGEILDCEQEINNEKIYVDREEFEEDVQYFLECRDDFENVSDEEFENMLKAEIESYEPYWRDVIMINAGV